MAEQASNGNGHSKAPLEFYSQSEVARRLNLTAARATAAVRRGQWREDAVQGGNKLFLATRLEELRTAELAGRGK